MTGSLRLGELFFRRVLRATLGRQLLVAVAAATATIVVLGLLSVPSVVTAQNAVLDRLEPRRASTSQATLATHSTTDIVAGGALTIVAVAVLDPAAIPPLWLERYPEPGEMVASPALAEMLSSDAAMSRRLPQRVVGVVPTDLTVAPDHLWALVGVNSTELAHGQATPAIGFGALRSESGVGWATIRLLLALSVLFVLLPCAAFISVAARLSGRTRARRLATLRLLGYPNGSVRLIAAAEVVPIAVAGVGFGWLAWRLLSRRVEAGVSGVMWHSDNVEVPGGVAAIACAVVVALIIATSQAAIARAVENPLEQRIPPGRERLSWWRLVPLAAGALLLALLTQLDAEGRRTLWLSLFSLGIAIGAIGSALAVAHVGVGLSRIAAVARSGPAAHLAARRIQHEATSTGRLANGFVVAVVVGVLAQSVLLVLDWTVADGTVVRPERLIELENTTLGYTDLHSIPGVAAVVGVVMTDEGPGLVGSCASLDALAPELGGGCIDNQHYVEAPGASTHDAPIQIDNVSGGKNVYANLETDIPHTRNGPAPTSWLIVAETADARDAVTADVRAVAAAADIRIGPAPERGRFIDTYRALVLFCAAIAMALSTGATVLAVVDRSLERRRLASQLAALGVPLPVLRRAEAIWIAIPLFGALATAGGIALLAALGFINFGSASVGVPTGVLLAGGGVSLVAGCMVVTATAVAVPRHADLESLTAD